MYNIIQPQKVLNLDKALKLKVSKITGLYIITGKIDGWFTTFNYTKSNNTWSAPLSSANRPIPAFNWLLEEGILAKLPIPKEDCILIAEAYIPDLIFSETNGIFNRSKGEYSCYQVRFALHDLVYISSNQPASTRYKQLQQLDLSKVKDYFHIVPIELVSEYHSKLWDTTFENLVNQGYEGLVAKRADSLYSFGKRNSDLLKLKLELTVDLVAIRLEEGFGEKGNPSLTLVSQRSNGIEVRTVISKHEDQALFRATPEAVIGKVVEIKAMEEFSDGQLRQPVFVRVREDKPEGE